MSYHKKGYTKPRVAVIHPTIKSAFYELLEIADDLNYAAENIRGYGEDILQARNVLALDRILMHVRRIQQVAYQEVCGDDAE